PRAVLLHALRADGADPGAQAHRPLRTRVRGRPIAVGVAALVAAGAVAPLLPSYPLTLLTQVAIMAVLAMSLDILLGYTGLPSLGHAAYFGGAAYAVGILATEHQAGFFTCLIAGVLRAPALAWAALGTLARSPVGLTLPGIRESETRMRALGYDVWLHKYLAFVISGGFAGFAGVLWAWYNGFVSPVDVQLVTSVETLLMVALGGPGTLAGPALGAAVIVFLKNFVSVYTKRWLL